MSCNKKIYIIGIGGISLSAIAEILRNKGAVVKGSDVCANERVEALRLNGFDVVVGHSRKFVEWADIIIISSAIPNEDEDLLLAKKLNKKIITRAEALGEISKMHKTISVAGCHGKTTTTGIISSILLCLDKKPSIHIGGILKNIKDNVFNGDSGVLVTEACEYKDSFLSLSSEIGVILNVKPDHLDYFKTYDNVKKSFYEFAQNVKKVLIVNGDDEVCKQIAKRCSCKVLTFGMSQDNDFYPTQLIEYQNGKFLFTCNVGKRSLTLKLPVYGKHNVYNALASIAVCECLNVDSDIIERGIESFEGISRRFERVYEDENKLIIHDYAHHPDEIKATIEAGRRLKRKRLIVVFQPHTFSRTRDFFDEFCSSLSLADEVWLLPIYPAREKPIRGISSYQVYKNIKKNGKKIKYFAKFSSIISKINKINDNSLILILGAGDIENLARMFENKS